MAGFVYVMSNPLFSRVKIGKSTKDPTENRLSELNRETGVPEKFKCEYYAFVEDETKVEQTVHQNLSAKRPNKGREFFEVSVVEAVLTIRKVAGKLGGVKYEEVYFKEYDLEDYSGKYVGTLKNGLEHGSGTRYFNNGNKYCGEFREGKLEGNGTLDFVNGDRYEGEFKEGLYCGHGKLTHGQRQIYQGSFQAGYFNGEGNLTYPNGNQYQGSFKNSKRHGYGILTFPSGTILDGKWKNDKKNGKFLCTSNGIVKREEYAQDALKN